MSRAVRLELAVGLLLLAGAWVWGYAIGRGHDADALRRARAAAAVDSVALAKARAELARRAAAAARAETVLVERRVATDRWLVRADSVPVLAPLVTAIRAERLAADSAIAGWRGAAVACDSLVAGEADRRARAIEAAVRATRDTLRAERRRRRWAEAGQWAAWGVAAALVLR